VPETVEFAAKPHLAQTMLSRALDAGIPAAWVTGDSVYGNDRALRQMFQQRKQPFVLAVKSDLRLPFLGGGIRASTLAHRVPPSEWQPLSCGDGAKGARLYDWARVPLDAPDQAGFAGWLLVRRSRSDPSEQAYYWVFAPQDTALSTRVAVAGMRWTIETNFETAKGEVGLDQYEVRSWHGWHRHMTLCLLAQAFLAVLRSVSLEAQVKKGRTFPRNSLRTFKQSRGLFCP
jgi:SRSO17 transposase